jgi:hypothetical protein
VLAINEDGAYIRESYACVKEIIASLLRLAGWL